MYEPVGDMCHEDFSVDLNLRVMLWTVSYTIGNRINGNKKVLKYEKLYVVGPRENYK